MGLCVYSHGRSPLDHLSTEEESFTFLPTEVVLQNGRSFHFAISCPRTWVLNQWIIRRKTFIKD
jgi:hypothetical protein